MRDAGFLQYVQMGVMHIFTGVDHMSFLLGLVLDLTAPARSGVRGHRLHDRA
jgi:hypothetical protein